MTDIITDTKTFTVTILSHGNLVVENLEHPTAVFEGAPFTIEYDATNNGGTDNCFGMTINTAGPTVLDVWREVLEAGNTKHTIVNIEGITEDLVASIEVGYED